MIALIGHLDSVRAYRDALTALRGPDRRALTDAEVERTVRRMAPMPICELTVASPLVSERPATYVDTFLCVDEGFALKAAVRKVRAACAEAARARASIAALGGFTSIVAEQAGLDLEAEHGVRFTTGNGLTAAFLAAQVRSCADEGATIAVVGAPGDVGSGVCRALRAEGRRLVLVGRSPRRLEALAAELDAPALPWDDAAPRADVVVLVASTGNGGIDLSGVRADAVVLDAGHPPNARAGRDVALAGRAAHVVAPKGGLPAFTEHNCARGEHHACMAEGELLGLSERWDLRSHGRGNLRPERLRDLLDLARAHGITPAPLRFRAASEAAA